MEFAYVGKRFNAIRQFNSFKWFKNCLLEVSLGEALKEVSAGVVEYFGFYYSDAWDGGFDYVYHILFLNTNDH